MPSEGKEAAAGTKTDGTPSNRNRCDTTPIEWWRYREQSEPWNSRDAVLDFIDEEQAELEKEHETR